jgi:hypothetical protein
VSLLVPILCTYHPTIPQIHKAFLRFLDVAEADFSVQLQEVVELNALSQIMLLIEDREWFNALFVSNLAQLASRTVIMFDNNTFAIEPFHPLLDANGQPVSSAHVQKLPKHSIAIRTIG